MGVATGFVSGAFGTGKVRLGFAAVSFKATEFGTPVLFNEVTSSVALPTATGFLATKFGSPTLQQVLRAQTVGWKATSFGTAKATYAARATGIAPTAAFGTAKHADRFTASGRVTTVFGSHKMGGILAAEGFQAAVRFGTPAAKLRNATAAAGFLSSHTGAPSSPGSRFRVMHIPPNARFGTPLLKRVTP